MIQDKRYIALSTKIWRLEMKPIYIDSETHEKLKITAQNHGMKLSSLCNYIIECWLEGEVFYLPSALRQCNTKDVDTKSNHQ